jgi:hypothetical protein
MLEYYQRKKKENKTQEKSNFNKIVLLCLQSYSFEIYILIYMYNQCLSPIKVLVSLPPVAMCTWYNFIGLSLMVTF